MTSGSDASTRAQQEAAAEGRAHGVEVGWTVSGYLLSGMAAYGVIGWLIGRAVHVALLFPLGMLVGLAISIGFIIYRYGMQGAVTRPSPRGRVSGGRPSGSAQKEMTGDR
jgi:F0F1-type ATP synthase assembly protein I